MTYPLLAIPSYFYPGGATSALWPQATAAAPKVSIMIMNPNSGPGLSADPNYQSAVAAAQAAGIKVLGYVPTTFGARPQGDVETDINNYKSWYAVDGIFLDETSDQLSFVSYYQTLATYIRSTSGTFVMLNPGVYPVEQYMAVGDLIVVFEGSYTSYASAVVPTWARGYPATRFSHLIYNTPDVTSFNQAMVLASQRNVGYIYVTDDNLPNPWDTLASYFSTEIAYSFPFTTAQFNQDTTGNAATATILQTPRLIYGSSFNGSADLPGPVGAAYGGTGLASPGANGNVLTSDGAGAWLSSPPVTGFTALHSGNGVTPSVISGGQVLDSFTVSGLTLTDALHFEMIVYGTNTAQQFQLDVRSANSLFPFGSTATGGGRGYISGDVMQSPDGNANSFFSIYENVAAGTLGGNINAGNMGSDTWTGTWTCNLVCQSSVASGSVYWTWKVWKR